MSENTPHQSQLLAAYAQHQETVAAHRRSIAEEERAFRERTEPHRQAIEDSASVMDERIREFFARADIDDFSNWETAAPLYRLRWERQGASKAFDEGFDALVNDLDTYLYPPLFSWEKPLVDWGNVGNPYGQHPLLWLTMILPKEMSEEKLGRTAKVAEKLFAPMVDVFPGLRIEVWTDSTTSSNAVLSVGRAAGGQYVVYDDDENCLTIPASMIETLRYIARLFDCSFGPTL